MPYLVWTIGSKALPRALERAMDNAAFRELCLIEHVKGGDLHAFDLLLEPFRRRLYASILRVMDNPSDADDVMQETLLCVFRGLKNFRGEACFYTWAFRIGFNCSLSSKRRRGLREKTLCSSEVDIEGELDESSSPDNILLGVQMVAAVDKALHAMNPEFHAAIVMHQFDGLSYTEVAHAMACPVGTVKSRIAKARCEIARKLKRGGFSAVNP